MQCALHCNSFCWVYVVLLLWVYVCSKPCIDTLLREMNERKKTKMKQEITIIIIPLHWVLFAWSLRAISSRERVEIINHWSSGFVVQFKFSTLFFPNHMMRIENVVIASYLSLFFLLLHIFRKRAYKQTDKKEKKK